ncbi:MAG TPA: crotonase/enoyl-CoA hydratase family protein [Burkholderiales bacterium]|nr:crotonase/enoyl-CoA hydratase family protein [Burkholderiales bacterium]
MDMHLPPALLEVTGNTQLCRNIEQSELFFSDQLSAAYDPSANAIWSRWTPTPRPSFNPDLLDDLAEYCSFVTATRGVVRWRGESLPIEYSVLASGVPGVFNLGGDLDLFVQLIERQDAGALLQYGKACVDVLYRNYVGFGLPVTTISLVQGECLGGGFEAALSSDIIIAERHARFGFPEILFNLFPGMGAYSFLDRRVGRRLTEELLGTGRIYSADAMLAMGVIDRVVDTGQGEAEVSVLAKRSSRSRNGLAGIARVRRRVNGVSYEELLDVVQLWVDAALRLTPRDIKLMQRLVARQTDILACTRVH